MTWFAYFRILRAKWFAASEKVKWRFQSILVFMNEMDFDEKKNVIS